MAAKTRYRAEYARIVGVMCRLGAINPDIMEAFGICNQTIYTWRKKYPDFDKAFTEGKAFCDHKVEEALYNRALGAIVRDDFVAHHRGEPVVIPRSKEYAPDTAACIAWLANRKPDKWRRIDSPNPGAKTAAEELAEAFDKIVDRLPD